MRANLTARINALELEDKIVDLGLEFIAILPKWTEVLVRFPQSRPVHLLLCAAVRSIEDLLNG